MKVTLLHHKDYDRTSLGQTLEILTGMITPGSRVLEVGCAAGFVTRFMTEQLGCSVTAVEIDPEQAAIAAEHTCEVIVGDIENKELWNRIKGPFEHVIFADVLEHLVDPWQALRKTHDVLAPNGSVLCSIPNVAYFRVRIGLFLGKFDYTDYGILDNSHLRFFTAKTARRLFTDTGFNINRFIKMYTSRLPQGIARLFGNALAHQFVIEARSVSIS